MRQAHKKMLLAAAFFASALAGAILAVSPALERMHADRAQEALLAKMKEAAGTAGRPETTKSRRAGAGSGSTGGTGIKTGAGSTEDGTGTEPEASGNGILTIPAVDAELPVVAGVSEVQLKTSECWVPQSSPVGSPGNAVVAGHRSYACGRHFNRLGELAAGDKIIFTTDSGERMEFKVRETLEVEPGSPEVFARPPGGEAWLTLYTCTPVRIATHRLLVRAVRVK